MSSTDFIDKFHNLDGTLLKEKKKSLFDLFKSIKNLSSEEQDSLIQNLQPSTYLEECNRIELLLYLKKSDNLLDVLISGDEIEASKIVRQGWFIQDLMKKYTPSQFVDDLLPKLSLSIRMKIIKKFLVYIKDENKIQELFSKLCEIYGSNIAIIVLLGCSNDFVKEYLSNNNVNLSATQLKTLFDKDKSLVEFYFESIVDDNGNIDNYKWTSFFDYVGIKDPSFYFEIADKYQIYKRKLGRQSTKKYVESKKDKILEKPNDFLYSLRKDAFVRKLGDDFPEFYKKLLPNNLSDFMFCNAKNYLKYYPKDKQYNLYFNTFQEKYNKNLWENIEYMDEELIQYIPDKETRDKWISKFENRENIKKYKISKRSMLCAAQCKIMDFEDDEPERENVIKDKKTIFNTLISTCKLTKDYDAFLNVLKSFVKRHRNSDVTIIYNFLRTAHKELNLKKFKEEHWNCIYEIIDLQLCRKQQIFYPMYIEYIKFLCSEKKSIEEDVKKLLNSLPHSLSKFEYKDDEFEKIMLENYLKFLPEITDDLVSIQIGLAVINWNQKNITKTIPLNDNPTFSKICSTKLNQTEKIDKNLLQIFKYLICRQNLSTETTELDQIYWSNFKNLNNPTITLWYVKYKPTIVKENLNKIGIMLNAKNINFIRRLKKYEHINIPKEITEICLKELEISEPTKRERIIKILLNFISQNELKQYIQQYTPKEDKLDVSGEDKQKIYEIQCALGKYSKLSLNLKAILPDLLNYCRGDLLASVLPSVYSSFCRIPSNQLYSSLDMLRDKAVSVRKHTIFLSCLILTKKEILNNYKSIQSNEKNESVKQHLFLSCYKYFIKNNVPECWPIIHENITHLQKKQKKVMKFFTYVAQVPKEYRGIFTVEIWNTMEKLKKENVKLDNNMSTLIQHLSKNDIALLDNEFCMNIIRTKLFDIDECKLVNSIFSFTQRYLLYGENTEMKMKFIFEVLHDFKEKFWTDDEKKIDALKAINNFCFDLLEILFGKNSNKVNKDFLKLFRDGWTKEFTIEETFEENLLIDFLLIKFESESDASSLPKQMSQTFSNALLKYGNLIIESFKNFLYSSLHLVFKNDNYNLQVIEFLDTFLQENDSPEHCTLVIELLPTGYLEEEAQLAKKNLIKKLFQKDEIIKIRLFGKLKSRYY